jgi:hypothetical protein
MQYREIPAKAAHYLAFGVTERFSCFLGSTRAPRVVFGAPPNTSGADPSHHSVRLPCAANQSAPRPLEQPWRLRSPFQLNRSDGGE